MDRSRAAGIIPLTPLTPASSLTVTPSPGTAPMLTAAALLATTAILATPAILFPAPTAAQQVTVLREDLCTTCSIEVTPDVELGTDGESVIGVAWDIHRLPDGRFVMAFQDVTYEFTIFSADGSSYRRVGQQGEGPGEYAHVYFVRDAGGHLHVFDRAELRLTVLDPDFEVVRTATLECLNCFGLDFVLLPDGATALNTLLPAGGREAYRTARTGFVIHVFDENGRLIHSMDEIPLDGPFSPAEDDGRFLEVMPDGSLLSVHANDYRIDRWDPQSGELLQSWVREGNPFAEGHYRIQPDEAGRLWVYVYQGLDVPQVVEVLDLDSGSVLVSQPLDQRGISFAPGWLADYDNEAIVPKYRMYRLRLVGMGE